jgi:hypothetical protein
MQLTEAEIRVKDQTFVSVAKISWSYVQMLQGGRGNTSLCYGIL